MPLVKRASVRNARFGDAADAAQNVQLPGARDDDEVHSS
jgi:hypothetical protein